MELYEQVDTIPIYQTSLILLNICAGAIVMQEARLYTFQEFLLIILCGLVSISGVQLIIKKPTATGQHMSIDYEGCIMAGNATNCPCSNLNFNIEKQIKNFTLKPKQDQEDIKAAVQIIRKSFEIQYHGMLDAQ